MEKSKILGKILFQTIEQKLYTFEYKGFYQKSESKYWSK
jgi:hypothetical protein